VKIKKVLWYSVSFSLVLLVMLFNACGGGGGGSTETGGISYSGLTTRAVITEDNAEEIVVAAYSGSYSPSQAVRNESEKISLGEPLCLTLSQLLQDAFIQITISNNLERDIVSDSGSIQGDCPGDPGYASYTISVNTITGDFEGTMSFIDYCSNGVSFSGDVTFNGQIDPNTLEYDYISMTFYNTSMSYLGESATIQGDISYTYLTSTSVNISMDLLLQDNTTDRVYWYDDVVITAEYYSSYFDFQVTGTFYYPDYGYVIITTPSFFRFYYGESYPPSGVMVATGEDNASAKLTALSGATYQVEVDSDGDDIYELDLGVYYW